MLPKDVRWLVNSLPVHRGALFFAIRDRGPVWIDEPGRVGIDIDTAEGEGRMVT